MCGIFGYVGQSVDAGVMVLDALKTLEYRGYDSWGVAVGVNGHIAVEKQTGKIGSASVDFPLSTIGFGHTRWATHGGVTQANAHPHVEQSGRLGIIHNGILENFRELKRDLLTQGFTFESETDTEVILNLVASELDGRESPAEVRAAISRASTRMAGLNAFIVLDRLNGMLFSVKNISPLVLGRSDDAVFIASDSLALEGKSCEVHYLDDGQLAQLSASGVELFDVTTLTPSELYWEVLETREGDSGLNGYPNFMLKEMHEQPRVIENVSSSLVDRKSVV